MPGSLLLLDTYIYIYIHLVYYYIVQCCSESMMTQYSEKNAVSQLNGSANSGLHINQRKPIGNSKIKGNQLNWKGKPSSLVVGS